MPATQPFLDPAWLSVLLLIGAAACWYLANRAAAMALPGRASAFAIGGGVPALAGVIWFTLTDRTDAALALALGVGVASATLAMGLVANSDPPEGQRVADDPGRRLKATLLPVAVILLVAGFSGALTPLHALLLLIAGGFVAWLGISHRRNIPTAKLAAPEAEGAPPTETVPAWAVAIQVTFAAALAVAGAGLAAGAAAAASRRQGMDLDATFATLLVSAIVALPLIGLGMRFVTAGHGLIAQRGLALTAVFMICLAVPAVVLVDAGQTVWATRSSGIDWQGLWASPPAVPMPLRLWRTDSVVLCLGGLLLLPPAAGRYRLGKIEGSGLILLYVAYLVVTLSSVR